MSIEKTKLAKGKGLLADAHSELCGLMNAFTYDGMTADVAGPWFQKVKGLLDQAATSMGISKSAALVSKAMNMGEFEQHLASEYALAKKDKPNVAKQRLMVLQQAIGVAKASYKKPDDTAEIPLFVAKTEGETTPTSETPTDPGKTTTPTPPAPVTEEQKTAGEGAEGEQGTPEEKAQLEDALKGLGSRVSALDAVGAALAKQTKGFESIEDMMDDASWPDDMATDASMRGDDPQDTIAKSDEGFGLDPWVKQKPTPVKPQAQPAK